MSVNTGSPKGRESHGDGVPIVLKCLESCPGHGEGEQVRPRDREKVGMRDAEAKINLVLSNSMISLESRMH